MSTSVIGAEPRGAFARNFTTNIIAFAVSFVVGIWFTPYLLHHLDRSLYGFIPLATIVTSYLSIWTISFNSSVGRFLGIAFARKDYAEANVVFNTAVVVSVVMTAILFLPGALLTIFASYIVKIPEGTVLEVQSLFACSVSVFLLSTLSAPFSSSAFTQNRLDISNAIKIVHSLLRVLAVVCLFSLFSPRLSHVGLAVVFATLCEFACHVWSWRRLTPTLSLLPSAANRQMFGQLVHTGGWLAAVQVGTILLLGVDLLLVNRMYGPSSASDYAVILQWVTLLRVFASSISTVFAPTIISLHGAENREALIRYSRMSVRLVGLMLALMAGVLCGFSQSLLRIWLGEDFVQLAGLMVLMIAPLAINLSVLPMFSMTLAANAVRWPGIANTIAGIANVLLAIALWYLTNLGVYGIAIAGAVSLTAKNVLFMPVYTARQIGAEPRLLIRETLLAGATTFFVTAVAWCADACFRPDSYSTLFASMAATGMVSIVAIYFFVLTEEERQLVFSFAARFRRA